MMSFPYGSLISFRYKHSCDICCSYVGALTFAIYRIFLDIFPLLFMLALFIIAFTGAIMILVMHELDAATYPWWHHFQDAMYIVLNIGLFTYYEPIALSIGRNFMLLFVYMVFMMFVQVVILNMLIAIMAESHNRVSNQAELVAHAGRAKLILEYEASEMARMQRRGKSVWRRALRAGGADSAATAQHRASAPAHGESAMMRMLRLLELHGSQRLHRVCPRWLHVLMPAAHQRGDEEEAGEAVKQVRLLRKQLSAMDKDFSSRQQKMLDAVGKRDDQGERQKMVEAIRVELAHMRKEVVADLKK